MWVPPQNVLSFETWNRFVFQEIYMGVVHWRWLQWFAVSYENWKCLSMYWCTLDLTLGHDRFETNWIQLLRWSSLVLPSNIDCKSEAREDHIVPCTNRKIYSRNPYVLHFTKCGRRFNEGPYCAIRSIVDKNRSWYNAGGNALQNCERWNENYTHFQVRAFVFLFHTVLSDVLKCLNFSCF